jgi:hypothetical protein
MKNNYKTVTFPAVMTIKLGDKENTELFRFTWGQPTDSGKKHFLSVLNLSRVPTENLYVGKWKRKLRERKETKQRKKENINT